MDGTCTTQDVSNFLKMLIELGDAYQIDDSPDKLIWNKVTNQPEQITLDGRNYPIAIYGTMSKEAMIVNPFAEGESKSVRTSWFYRTASDGVAVIIVGIMDRLIKIAVEDGKRSKKDREEKHTDLTAIKLMTNYVKQIDEKMSKELSTITKKIDDFFSIAYNTTTKQGEIRCLLFNPAQRKAFSSVRVKTWEVFEGLFLAILNTTSLNSFDYKPTVIGAPAFESFANILVHIYEVLQEPAKLIGCNIDPKTITSLRSHLKYFPQYYDNAKWCVTAVPQDNTVTLNAKNDTVAYTGNQMGFNFNSQLISPTAMPGISTVSSAKPQNTQQSNTFQPFATQVALPYGVSTVQNSAPQPMQPVYQAPMMPMASPVMPYGQIPLVPAVPQITAANGLQVNNNCVNPGPYSRA